MSTVVHGWAALGRTQASRVMPVVRSRALLSATVTQSLTPSKDSAWPKRPLAFQVAPLMVPLRPLPVRSPRVVPLPSLKLYAATRPVVAVGLATLTVMGADRVVLPA